MPTIDRRAALSLLLSLLAFPPAIGADAAASREVILQRYFERYEEEIGRPPATPEPRPTATPTPSNRPPLRSAPSPTATPAPTPTPSPTPAPAPTATPTPARPEEDERAEADEDEAFLDEMLAEYDEEQPDKRIADPVKPVNKGFFVFNDKLFEWGLKPLSVVWKVFPRPVRVGLDNMMTNLAFPKRFFNNGFQGKFGRAGTEAGSFLTDTTIGIVGLWRPSRDLFGWERYPEDFDQTLAVWGMGQGPYLNWPFFGPSSGRGTLGLLLDIPLDGVSYIPGGRFVYNINRTSLGKTEYEQIKEMAVEPYAAVRSSYVQNRRQVVRE